ncbi:MAG: hypothetical protein AAFX99_25510 [Myxococcota bacterium]
MMHNTLGNAVWISVTAVALVAACGDDGGGGGEDNLDGVYEVTSHTITQGGCDGSSEPVNYDDFGVYLIDKPFFVVRGGNFFGAPLKDIYGCETADTCPDSMDENSFADQSFFERSGDTWTTVITSAGGSSAGDGAFSCSVDRTVITLEPTEAGVRMTQRVESTEPFETATNDACLDLSDAPPEDRLNCSSVETLEATTIGAE